MRRISLTLALMGAFAAGCGGGAKPASSGGTKGTAGVDFTVTVNNQGPGTVTSDPAGINCAASTTCSATFTAGTTVVLTATATGTNYFNGFYGDCSGTSCSLSSGADKYVVAFFSATAQAHANWAGGHPASWDANCGLCHGKNGAGQGVAPACASCHTGNTAQKQPFAMGKREECGTCHPSAGADHQARYNAFADGINPGTTKFAVSNVSVAVTDSGAKKKATVTFTLTKNGQPFTGDPATLKQKTIYFVTYDAATKKFPTPSYKQTADIDPDGTKGGQNTESVNFSFGSMKAVAGQPGVFTMVKDLLPSDPVAAATNAFVYGYFGDANVPMLEGNLNPGGRHYALMDNMVSFAVVLKGTIDYASTATVSGCERCHGAPYSKHGYRQATVAGLNDFVACKACHTDFRRGTDAGWYLIVDDPAKAAAGVFDDAVKLKYAYTANVMQDTHNSHAMEFAYPQTMANCTTCHEGKLDRILTDANFVGTVCKSCHATTNTADIEKRAPSFAGPALATALSHHNFNWVDVYDASHNLIGPAGTIKEDDGAGNISYMACNECHADDIADGFVPGVHLDPADPKAHDGIGPMLFALPTPVPLFKDIHSGKIPSVYAADGSKYSATVVSTIDSIVVSKATNQVTVGFSVTGAPAGAVIAPTIAASLYGYDTKDFIVSSHGKDIDTARNLEWAGTDTARMTVSGTGPWTVTANLSAWAAKLADGSIKKMEIGFLPAVTLADGTTSIAISGLTATIDLTVDGAGTPVANQYGKSIVDTAKCNKCHEALGTTFHSPSYGSAGVVGCRLCHVVGTGSSHLEMQSRSIDSFVHALHSYQFMDSKSINFADPVAAFEYEEHIDSVYPNFTVQNCESCHNPGTYGVPAQNRSLPSISSASWAFTGKTRAISGVAAAVTGPADRACGSCHRSKLINEDDATGLANFNQHTSAMGYRLPGDTATLSNKIVDLTTAPHPVLP